MKSSILTAICFCMSLVVSPLVSAADSEYQLGRGYRFSDALIVGGYFSAELGAGQEDKEFAIDDLALLVYGNVTPQFSYMLELESVDFYKADLKNHTDEKNIAPIIERLYGDFKFSDAINIRFGKQITPVGHWNLQPINVLRETTSNPRLSRMMFPKFLTGVDLYGYLPIDDSVKYHFYIQASEDLDNERINIDADSHYGFSLQKQITEHTTIGSSVGYFEDTTDTETHYLHLNSKWSSGRYKVTSELNYNFNNPLNSQANESQAIYVQGEYKFHPRHSMVGRVEYFHDPIIDVSERIGIIGYSYRPQYPISIKLEYQWHADSNENQLLSSFSVLF